MSEKKILVVLAGPTASGKTDAAIKIAQYFGTEIISADSRQFYKEMAIGTAVPSRAQLEAVPHHFIQNRSVHKPYDIASYEQEVLSLLKRKFQEHRLMVLTGGSGLYIDAICLGIDNMPEVSNEVRQRVQALYDREGIAGMQRTLQSLDPKYYAVVDRQNPRRLQRAIEVCYATGKAFSFFRKRQTQNRDFDVIWLALSVERIELINRINLRVERMMKEGLVEEARKLHPYKHLPALNTVGYKELFAYFDQQTDLEEAVEQIKVNTRQYAKRQMTWFRKNKGYQWFSPNSHDEMIGVVRRVLDESGHKNAAE